MSEEKQINKADNPEDLTGIYISYRNNDWIIRIDEKVYKLCFIGQNKDGKYYIAKTKYYRKLSHMLPNLRRYNITPIMKKKNRQTFKELLKEIEKFNKWAKENFKIKLENKEE